MIVRNFILETFLFKIEDEELCKFITNSKVYNNSLELLLTPDNKVYIEKEKYSLEDLLSAEISKEVFSMHSLNEITSAIKVTIEEMWEERKEVEKEIIDSKQEVVRLRESLCKVSTEKNSLLRRLNETKQLLDSSLYTIKQLEDELRLARKELSIHKEKESNERSKFDSLSMYSIVDSSISDLFKEIVNKVL